jgi:hypothetical protein
MRAMKRSLALLLGLAGGALFLGTARAYVIPPEPLVDLGVGLGGGVDALTGAWTARISRANVASVGTPTAVQLSLRPDHRGSESQHSGPCLVTEMNLSSDQVAGAPKEVSFELVRDAGALRFAGRFQSGEGSGHFTFMPRADFIAGMSALGYPAIDTEKAYTLATLDVSRRFIEELGSLGHRGLTLDQLVALRVHGADAPFIRALQTLGYDYLSADRLVSFRIQGVSPDFITEMKGVGYGHLSPYDLESFRAHGVSAEFVRDLQALGYRSATPADLVNMRVQGVTPDFVQRANARAKTALTVSRLVDLRTQARP